MRILAIGIGGAGGRIVNHLYRTDRRSSKIACVQALAIDVDEGSLAQLTDIPDSEKLYFPPMDISQAGMENSEETATIDIAQITSRIQAKATGETDAIFFYAGLGGGMVDTLPHIIAAVRSSVTEPIFALVTLPCLSEGERCSSKAADDIETISSMLDGIIIFDNETWHHKLKTQQKAAENPDEGFAVKIGLKKRKEPALTPRERMYSLLNDAIVRRVSLILRAGEFKADGGLDLAEVVLDAGEVLNTMKGMGFITIGYAVEQLPSRPLDFLAWLHPTGLFSDEQNKKASRIVDLAKQAIYQEISAPCDITSAHKALVLIAGPSHEISMKGFMTVRKWIDRSIAGLETRSGDYPVTSTRFIAIIIMLSGLENIPRIGELKEIRAQYRARVSEQSRLVQPSESPDGLPFAGVPTVRKDDMIVLPSDKGIRAPESGGGRSKTASPRSIPVIRSVDTPVQTTQTPGIPPRPKSVPLRQEPVPSHDTEEPGQPARKVLKTDQRVTGKDDGVLGKARQMTGVSEQERRRIEQELLKQRKLAIGGPRGKQPAVNPASGGGQSEGERRSAGDSLKQKPATDSSGQKHVVVKKTPGKTVVVRKKTVRQEDDTSEADQVPASEPDTGDQEMLDSWIRRVSDRKKTDSEDDAILVDESHTAVRDDALVHTDLKRDRQDQEEPDIVPGIKRIDSPREIKPGIKKRDRSRDDDDLSWVE